jgi:hypothetical protein
VYTPAGIRFVLGVAVFAGAKAAVDHGRARCFEKLTAIHTPRAA